MRHDPGLAASPLVRYKLKWRGAGTFHFSCRAGTRALTIGHCVGVLRPAAPHLTLGVTSFLLSTAHGAEYDLACIGRDVDRSHRGLSVTDNDGQLVVSEPRGQSARICVKYELRDLGVTGGVPHRGLSRERGLWRPLDEERKAGRGSSLIDPGAPPVQLVSTRRGPRSSVNW